MTRSEPGVDSAAAQSLASVGGSRGWRIAFGALTLVVGLIVLIWPQPTVVVLAVLFGIQLFVAGIFWLVAAFGTSDASGGGRVLLALLGLLLIVVGILCLREPFQTVAVLTLLLGLIWVVGGVIEVFHGFGGGGGWNILSGVVSLALGIILLAYPDTTLVVLTWLVGLALVIYGLTGVLVAIAGGRGAETAATSARPGRAATT